MPPDVTQQVPARLTPDTPRQRRLAKEWSGLQAINQDSDTVHIEPIDVLPGRAPETYKVTFKCRGIVGIDTAKKPVYGSSHQVQIYCHAGFPADVPWLKWLTPIWHPNIEHKGEWRVCVNKAEWLGGMSLADLCQQLFEMVQYKNYHAALTPPFPLDGEAATWVRDYAEPRGIVDKKRDLYVDNQMFYKPAAVERALRIKIVGAVPPPTEGPRVKFHFGAPSAADSEVVMEAGAGAVPCLRCKAEMPVGAAFCGACGTQLSHMARRAVQRN